LSVVCNFTGHFILYFRNTSFSKLAMLRRQRFSVRILPLLQNTTAS